MKNLFTMTRKVISALILISSFVLILAPQLSLRAQESQSLERQVKSAILYHLSKFVEWPSAKFTNADRPFFLCVLGTDPFGSDLDQVIKGKSIQGRPIAIKRVSQNENTKGCDTLFVGQSEANRIEDVVGSLAQLAVLTVSDTSGFTRHGGMIQLFIEEGKVRFEINRTNVERAGLQISSEVLKLAKVVQ